MIDLPFVGRKSAPNRENIDRGYFEKTLPQHLPGWYAIMGLQFENLLIQNKKSFFKLLGINPAEIMLDNPYFQRKTVRQAGCQIDYMIQTRLNTLFISLASHSYETVEPVNEPQKGKIAFLGWTAIPL